MKVKSESEVTQSCPTLRNPMDYSLPGSSVHRIFQARVLEWGAIAFSEVLPRSWLMMPQAKTDVFKVGHMWQNLGHLDQVSKGFPPPPFIEELY